MGSEVLTCVIDLSTACIHCLQQLVDFFIAHLLAEVGEDFFSSAFDISLCFLTTQRHSLYRSCPTPMYPVISLSKTWNPRQYSSGSPGSLKPPGRLRTFWKESKSTIVSKRSAWSNGTSPSRDCLHKRCSPRHAFASLRSIAQDDDHLTR